MMVVTDQYGETRDGTGWGDHDKPFTFGHPLACLTYQQATRCLIMRGVVRDVSHAPDSIRAQLRFGGDDDWVVTTPGGIVVPQTPWFGPWSVP